MTRCWPILLGRIIPKLAKYKLMSLHVIEQQGAGINEKSTIAIETLRPKLEVFFN